MPEPDKVETIVSFEIPPGYREDARLDVYLARSLQNASRSKVQRGIREGRVAINGQTVTRVSRPVQAGDLVVCRILRPPPMTIEPEDIPLDVVFEDPYLLVIDKPAGMVVHPAYGHRSGTLVHALLHHVGGRGISFDPDDDEEGEDDDPDGPIGLSSHNVTPRFPGDPAIRPGIVHRLDKDTSGLLVVAKDDHVHARLADQFARRTVRREYHALVWGVPDPPSGRVETLLGRDPRDRRRVAVVREGKHAVTNYRMVEPFLHTALVAFRLETGRTHQIRVHARHLNHPILSDAVYGGDRIRFGPDTSRRRAFFRNLFALVPRQALHARTLGFLHPVTGEEMDFERPLPTDMAAAVAKLRSGDPG